MWFCKYFFNDRDLWEYFPRDMGDRQGMTGWGQKSSKSLKWRGHETETALEGIRETDFPLDLP